MKTIICIVRHGQTDRNKNRIIQGRGDYLLNEEGKKQASMTADYFLMNNETFDVVVSSPLSRAFDTANIIKSKLDIKVDTIICDGFIEREFGAADGVLIGDDIYQHIINDDVVGMEKSYEIQKRVINATIKLVKKYPGKRILVVSHSHAIKGLLTGIDKNRSFLDTLYNCAINYVSAISNKDGEVNLKIEKVNISALEK